MAVLNTRLANLINQFEYDGLDGDADDEDHNMDITSNNCSYQAEFLSTSFMRPLKAGGDEGQTKFQRHGHRAEKHLMNQLYEIFNDIQQEERIEAIYQPGLVYHGGTKGDDKFWLRDSSDGVALIDDRKNSALFSLKVEWVERWRRYLHKAH